MSNINLGRVVLGGLVAGVVINVFEFVLNGIVLAPNWPIIMDSINRPALGTHAIVAFNIVGFILGLAAVWTYAAIRPRFGAGVKTAVYAGLLTWVVGSALANASPAIMGVFPAGIAMILIGVGLVEIVVATIAGAYIYKDA
jgi:hypothetical protein